VCGGLGIGPQIRAFRAGVGVVVAMPGRLLDHITSGAATFGALDVLVR
jgi:ATP-dependent RNA helicase RhlE